MILTEQNYFSKPMMSKYFSVSQYKDFCGTLGGPGCEAKALAKLKGEWEDEQSTAMLVGSYVDAHFSGTLMSFKAQHPEILKKDMTLKAEYINANEVITRIERDPYFMLYLQGKKQVIMTAEIFGVQWKCKIDFLHDDMIVDLKVMAQLNKAHWAKDVGHMSFIPLWGYDIQAAIYQKIVEVNTGKKLPFFIAAASKEASPDIQIITFTQANLNECLSLVEPSVERIKNIKIGKIIPDRCELCDYCRHTKILSKPIHYSELLAKVS
ncbi:MAG: hypothetical protein HC880_00430 [Bacteroidia bacterium]|nr:hypothetical protein [Bacteroidia bacterium]